LRSKRILLIEDNTEVQLFVSRVAALEGASVVAVGTIAEGVIARGREVFDLIVLDLELPDANGLEALEQLGLGEAGPPVVVFTASNDPSLLQEAADRGVKDIIPKPVTAPELRRRLIAALG
jgi:CheY-like chemotaxis protein